jgi:Cu+-exporting ATPase
LSAEQQNGKISIVCAVNGIDNSFLKFLYSILFIGEICMIISVSDPVKPEATLAIYQLQHMGLRTVLLTGDNVHTATVVAKHVCFICFLNLKNSFL